MKFIKATEKFNDFKSHVPAPLIRKSFFADHDTTAKIKVAATGFYEIYINGERKTRGALSPYICNPDHFVYFDEYEFNLPKGENVLGLILGNGFQNNPGGYVWSFHKAPFRDAPKVAVEIKFGDVVIESDSSFKTAESPIRFDDYRFGEIYDARYEIPSWNKPGFDDSSWNSCIEIIPPRGELKKCEVFPILPEKEIKPKSVTKVSNGYIYDFGESNAGVCRLEIVGARGQKIEFQHADRLIGEELDIAQIWFDRDVHGNLYGVDGNPDYKTVHKDTYICRGVGKESYTPRFTYHGFRYVKVSGITDSQATENLLTFVVLHTALKSLGGFSCSSDVVNSLQEITRRSDISNFYHFPTDCPQREKNGWTADCALSAEQMMLNFNPEVNYREWLKNICKAQDKSGALPGIIPTGGWGFEWGNGPAWDCVLVYLPYFVYKYRGEVDMIKESAASFIVYLNYLTTRKDENGLMHIGLGDWCQVGGVDSKAPLEVTDSIISMDISAKMAFLFDAVGMIPQRDFAKTIAADFKSAIRKNLIDFETATVKGNCQASQAMAIYYGVFTEDERPRAFKKFLELIKEQDDHIDLGVLGGRVIFHVLSEFGESELAYKMITRPDFPSYGNWLVRGATTLWEDFKPDDVSSMNHHFWGDISAWFIKCLGGIQFNPKANNINEVDIKPSFVSDLSYACAHYEAPGGLIKSEWKRQGENINLSLLIPENMSGEIVLPAGFKFESGENKKRVLSGEYLIKCE
jgi:alpha-L-rhamnosidase